MNPTVLFCSIAVLRCCGLNKIPIGGLSMTSEEFQSKCVQISHFIHYELSNWIDLAVFTQNSFEDLGELYYQHILSHVDMASIDLINRVVKADSPKSFIFEQQADYYTALCKLMRLKSLPSAVFPSMQQKFNSIFVQLYTQAKQTYISKINQINSQLLLAKQQSNSIKQATPSLSFLRDLTSDEDTLLKACSDCNMLRTRKEMLEFGMNYVDTKLFEFCDINDPQKITETLSYETLKLCKTSSPNIDFIFSPYQDYLDLLLDDINRSYLIFFKIKVYTIIDNGRSRCRQLFYTKSENDAVLEYKNYLSKIPKFDVLNQQKATAPSDYNNSLAQIVSDYSLINELKENINKCVTLRHRKNLLSKAVTLFEEAEYDIFNNFVPIQIEGAFADFLTDATTFTRFTHMDIYTNAVLKDKIKLLEDHNSNIYPEAIEYFKFYFNNLIRNKIAHGKYSSNSDSLDSLIFAHELLMDLCTLVHMIIRRSETEKMYRFIHGYKSYYEKFSTEDKNPVFEPLFNDMTGKKTIHTYDALENYRPIQVTYWLINPYYEKIYGQVDDTTELLALRNDFLSKEFWEFVLERLNDITSTGWDYISVSDEFLSVVKGLFKCNLSHDVRNILGNVHAALVKIKSFH